MSMLNLFMCIIEYQKLIKKIEIMILCVDPTTPWDRFLLCT